MGLLGAQLPLSRILSWVAGHHLHEHLKLLGYVCLHGLENKTASEQLSSTGQLLKLIYQGYAGFGGLGEQASPANSHLDDSIIPSILRDRFLQIQRLSSLLARFDSGESLCLTSRCQTSNRFRAGGHDAAAFSRIQLTISGPASHNQTHSNCNSWYGHLKVSGMHVKKGTKLNINQGSTSMPMPWHVLPDYSILEPQCGPGAKRAVGFVGQQSHAHWASATSFLSYLASCHMACNSAPACLKVTILYCQAEVTCAGNAAAQGVQLTVDSQAGIFLRQCPAGCGMLFECFQTGQSIATPVAAGHTSPGSTA